MTHRPLRRLAPLAAGLAAVLLLGGCDLGPDWSQPALAVPGRYRDAAPAGTNAAAARIWPSPDWWRGFRSSELDRLVAETQRHNFDIAAAVAQIRAADAAVRIGGSALLPSLSGSGGARWQQSALTSRGVGTTVFTQHTYDLGLNISYQADFWGRNLASLRSAEASAVASRYNAQTVALTAVTAVAQTWFTALADADRLRFAEQNLKDAEATLAVIRGRLDAGTATALDIAQQEALVNAERANIPALRNQIEQELIGLGILTGRPPEQVHAVPGTLDDLSLPPVAPGLPAALLRRRPDVAAAEAQLVAANFNIKAARAAFFPTVDLTGQRGYQSAALASLFTPGGIIASAAASLAQPLFDGGLLRGQLEQSKAQYEVLLADYRKAVVQAFTDVDNALAAWRYATTQEALQRQAVASAARAAAIARAQLGAGTVDVTTVLSTEATLYGDEDTLAQVRLARVVALLDLYKALGGGWKEPAGPIQQQFPGLHPGLVGGGLALPVGENVR
ncbi:MAG: TolC family protein [Rhodospirillales bacterium]|nr:TolC family protein [Rhodospirillales bacterium]